jgi:hypothetical protein
MISPPFFLLSRSCHRTKTTLKCHPPSTPTLPTYLIVSVLYSTLPPNVLAAHSDARHNADRIWQLSCKGCQTKHCAGEGRGAKALAGPFFSPPPFLSLRPSSRAEIFYVLMMPMIFRTCELLMCIFRRHRTSAETRLYLCAMYVVPFRESIYIYIYIDTYVFMPLLPIASLPRSSMREGWGIKPQPL